jgi:hypothetical protein
VASITPMPFQMYGMLANRAINNHAVETTASPSTRRMLSTAASAALPPAFRIKWPIATVSASDIVNPAASRKSPSNSASASGATNIRPKTRTTTPLT